MTFLLVALLGLSFGAADQQLGTLTAELGPWTSTAAQTPIGIPCGRWPNLSSRWTRSWSSKMSAEPGSERRS
jgi:hypothetical protein